MAETIDDVYVVHYNFEDQDCATAAREFENLIYDLAEVGFNIEVRPGYDASLLVFVKAPRQLLGNAVYKSRVKDWLYMISHARPEGTKETSIHGDTEAENLRSMFHLVTWSKEQGGAGVTPQHGKWTNVTSAFPMHNRPVVRTLLARWSRQLYLKTSDLDDIRSVFGEKVAFYFAFLQTYSLFLLFPAVTGLASWLYLPNYSLVYALITSLWCIVFVEYWKHREVDLSLRWGVKGVGVLKVNRLQYTWEKEVVDPITGERKKHFPAWKHVCRQLLQIPFGLAAFVALGALITVVFAVEIFISELYEGPFKSYLEYLPTILLSGVLPAITSVFERLATDLTEYENHRTRDRFDMALTQKKFMLNFVTSFLPIILTAFVYVPFGKQLAPHLEKLFYALRPWFSSSAKVVPKSRFQVDSSRLRNEVIALTVSGQIFSYGEELILPHLKRVATRKYREYRSERGQGSLNLELYPAGTTNPDEAAFVAQARNEADLEEYDVQEDLMQMVVQFGYLALFSPAWPLVPMGFLINNWIEFRSDFLKICIECQRPPPIRTDSIGPWLDSLGFLTWLGSIVTAAIVHIFGNDKSSAGNASSISCSGLTLMIFFSEHVYLAVRYIVAFALRHIGSDSIRRDEAERYMLRKQILEEFSIREEGLGESKQPQCKESKEARLHSMEEEDDVTTDFWKRQPTPNESVNAGVEIIKAYERAKDIKKEA